ncbi:AP-5 complex subunit sigma-1-like isoform X2 [Branchiostoma floridae x Branchiostoma japonicum]
MKERKFSSKFTFQSVDLPGLWLRPAESLLHVFVLEPQIGGICQPALRKPPYHASSPPGRPAVVGLFPQVRRHLSQEGAVVPQTGIFQMPPGEPFGTKVFTVWQTAANCGLALVCENHENRQQAAATLSQIFRLLRQHLRVLTQPEEVLQKADRVAAILHHFLPQGQLLFLNSRAVRHKEKELELMLSGK